MLLVFPFMLTWLILEPQTYMNQSFLTGSPIENIASIVLIISAILELSEYDYHLFGRHTDFQLVKLYFLFLYR